MARYTKDFPDVKIESYNDVMVLVKKVESIISPEIKRKYDFNFKCGSISCCASSIDEFIQNAYGTENFKINAFQLFFFLQDEKTVCFNYLGSLTMSASSKSLLDEYVNLFEDYFNSKETKQNSSKKVKDSNPVPPDSNNTKTKANKEKNSFWKGVIQNTISLVLSSIILKVLLSLGAIVLVAVPFFSSHNDYPPNVSLTETPAPTPSPETTAQVDEQKSPSSADLYAINSKIRYPKETKYLSEYKYGTINAPKNNSVNGYYYSKDGEIYFYPKHGERVIVLALENFRACVIVESEQKACWINSDYILYDK